MTAYPDFYPGARMMTSPNFSDRNGMVPEAAVLHIAEGTLAGGDSWFATPASQVSAHFMVGKTGIIHQYVPLSKAAWANGAVEAGASAALIGENWGVNPNLWGVSIEHEGWAGEALTALQVDASVTLTAWLFKSVFLVAGASGVAVDRKHILRHSEISPQTRPGCPGWAEANLADYVTRVQQALAGPAAKTYEQGVVATRDAALAQIRVIAQALSVARAAIEGLR